MVENNQKGENVKKITIMLLALIIIMYALFIDITRINGASMENTLYDGEYHLALKTKNVKQGDVVVFETDDGSFFIKRVIATPHDTIEFIDELVYVNGKQIEEPYIKDGINDLYGLEGELTLQSDEYFVMGDNREYSNDSRNFGAIKKEKIRSKLFFSK